MQNWPKVEVLFSKNLHVSPLELDQLDFYRVENILDSYEEMIDEENKANAEEQKKLEKQQSQTIPKIEVPKINIPKM